MDACHASLTLRHRAVASGCATIALLVMALGATSGCRDVNAALEELSEARQLSADLLVQFTKATDATNRAVMADTDEASVAFAHEAEQAKLAVQHDVDTLGPMLQQLNYAEEAKLLQEFVGRFAAYNELDHRILDLAVENTNLKAQRLSYGPGQEAADAFRDALETLPATVPSQETWHARALAATAIAAVREIQALQAPHIAEAEDAVMSRLEKRMSASEAAARSALNSLATIVPRGAGTQLGAATAALDRFMTINTQILELSHRNTNVRSLALSLSEKPALSAACEAPLRALSDALGKRGYHIARWK